MNRRKLYHYFFILLYWILSILFLSNFAILSVKGFMRSAGISPESLTDKMAIYWISPGQYVEGLLSGLFLGSLFLLINEISDRYNWFRFGFGRLIMIKSVAYGLGFAIIFYLIFLIINAMGFYPEDLLQGFVVNTEIMWIFFMILSFLIFQIVLLNYVIETNKKIGDFNIISFLSGKYRNPVLEDRLFMFLDLRSSTTTAERLGDVKYSQLIRDCFKDFNYCFKRFSSLDIYQYVGDEVVVTAKWKNGKDAVNMLSLYFVFAKRLARRSKHYKSTFGVQPFFKAGIHGGRVSVTEVGTLRRDIAFHGDVINTASRIQGLCNELQQGLLISAATLGKNDSLEKYDQHEMGAFHLRGKEETIDLVAIHQKEPQ